MWTTRLRLWRFMLCILFCASAMAVVSVRADDVPSESQCRPYIEKALKELESGDTEPVSESVEKNDSSEVSVNDDTKEVSSVEDDVDETSASENNEKDEPSVEVADEPYMSQTAVNDDKDSKEEANTEESNEVSTEGEAQTEDLDSKETIEDEDDDAPDVADSEDTKEEALTSNESQASQEDQQEASKEAAEAQDSEESQEEQDKQEDGDSQEGDSQIDKDTTEGDSKEDASADEKAAEQESGEDKEEDTDTTSEVEAEESSDASKEADDEDSKQDDAEGEAEKETEEDDKKDSDEANEAEADTNESTGKDDESQEDAAVTPEEQNDVGEVEALSQKAETEEVSDENVAEGETAEQSDEVEASEDGKEESQADSEAAEEKSDEEGSESAGEQADESGDAGETPATDEESTSEEEGDGTPEEDLLYVGEIPENLRSRDHINQILRLDETASEDEITIERSADIILRDLKRLYENSIKPLETLYKYRDLSNRHFGDPEIFSKPLVLFMGPWSGGKSSIVNYLTGLEFTQWSLRTGAEPSPAYFNILMHGNDPEVLDGTQLAADWTFSGLQKFGQGLEERLRGLRHPSKILEKVNIVEIPGILEVRKQVSRVFPFNDACQWFIDRADIIFLVYDPSKLDVGPETEAILDQLKGRESQTRIVLNKADTVKPEELMRVQSALIWNISPLMSSAQPPVMYTVSLWSMPYEAGAPVRLLQAQERELLRDLRHAIDKRIENKIASARRFAVRVRNHAKMVDCYLTTYFNHKTIFGNRKIISDAIIENPQNYHIYEGLSTLTNISRYDLPDPETYRDFFRLNPLYEFQQLSATCTYFRGCPITRLDVAIAYDLPELVGKYKKMVETATPQGMPKS